MEIAMTAQRMIRPATAFAATSRRLKRQRVDSKDHLRFIRSLPCIVTGASVDVEAAHVSYEDLRYGKLGRGKGQKEEDCWTLPLCRDEHAIQHESDEGLFWAVRGINPCAVALALWRCSGDYETALIILHRARD